MENNDDEDEDAESEDPDAPVSTVDADALPAAVALDAIVDDDMFAEIKTIPSTPVASGQRASSSATRSSARAVADKRDAKVEVKKEGVKVPPIKVPPIASSSSAPSGSSKPASTAGKAKETRVDDDDSMPVEVSRKRRASGSRAGSGKRVRVEATPEAQVPPQLFELLHEHTVDAANSAKALRVAANKIAEAATSMANAFGELEDAHLGAAKALSNFFTPSS